MISRLDPIVLVQINNYLIIGREQEFPRLKGPRYNSGHGDSGKHFLFTDVGLSRNDKD
jgi:hypothetical protein